MNTLEGRVAIVTGAARGMGAAEARLLADHGAKVVPTEILAGEGRATAEAIGDRAIFACDAPRVATGSELTIDGGMSMG